MSTLTIDIPMELSLAIPIIVVLLNLLKTLQPECASTIPTTTIELYYELLSTILRRLSMAMLPTLIDALAAQTRTPTVVEISVPVPPIVEAVPLPNMMLL